MTRFCLTLFVTMRLLGGASAGAEDAKPLGRYFAHPAVEDRSGVIAPWYRGPNGQCDFRVRIAAETLKRYPWTTAGQSAVPGPHFIFNGTWKISPEGAISINPALPDWTNGDVGQRSASPLFWLSDYYRYTGDPAAVAIVTMTADYVLDYCQTPADHAWPLFFISAPVKGKAYGRADPHGFIQLDLVAQVGMGMVVAHQLTGNPRYWEAAKHWADVLAQHCDRRPGVQPWGRYANPEDTPWKNNTQKTGVALILRFLDGVIRAGYSGKDGALPAAREAGDRYLRDVLLPQWSRDPTFGHHFWDWDNPVATCSLPCFTAEYLMDRRESFPDWRGDVRNITSLFFSRAGVDGNSSSGVHSGAWTFPESSGCCGDALQYPTMTLAATLARYGAIAPSGWAAEVARRQAILTTYDVRETGVVVDGIRGGVVTTGDWFNLAHPWPLRCVMQMLAWQPEWLGANRENHIMRSTSVVADVRYGKGQVSYRTYNAPAGGEDVLRLAFRPTAVLAGGEPLPLRQELSENGYTVKTLANGDCIVTIRHDGRCDVVVEGSDPQQTVEDDRLQYEGAWTVEHSADASGGQLHAAETAGASMSFEFTGDQVRLIGRADPRGGRADVYLDGVKQLCGIDFWCPQTRGRQVLCYKNGLAQGKHTLKVAAAGERNPLAVGARVYIDTVQWSAAEGDSGFGQGGGPADAQRVIFGYVGRKDYVDSQGHSWRPATEFVLRLKPLADLVPIAFWSEPKLKEVAGTSDAELYRYGVHGRDFTAYFTVDPQAAYYARIKLCEPKHSLPPGRFATTIDIQGKTAAADVDIAATAGGPGKAVDLVFNDIRPEHGVIAIRFRHRGSGEAMCQAIEIGPGRSAPGAEPVRFQSPPDAKSN
jgi:hypothetical protein